MEATSIIMVGGVRDYFNDCLAISQAMGNNIVYCEEIGAGQVVKACNQILITGLLETASEARVLGQRLALTRRLF